MSLQKLISILICISSMGIGLIIDSPTYNINLYVIPIPTH